MGEVVPARTSPTLHPPIPSHCASIVATSTLRVKGMISDKPMCLYFVKFMNVLSAIIFLTMIDVL